MKFNKIKLSVKLVWIGFILILCDFTAYSSTFEIGAIAPFQQDEEQNGYIAGLGDEYNFAGSGEYFEYKPFSDVYYNTPVLKGPPGPPINGLPVDGAYWVFAFLAIIYCAVKGRHKISTQ